MEFKIVKAPKPKKAEADPLPRERNSKYMKLFSAMKKLHPGDHVEVETDIAYARLTGRTNRIRAGLRRFLDRLPSKKFELHSLLSTNEGKGYTIIIKRVA